MRHLNNRELQTLTKEEAARLASVRKVEGAQRHVRHSTWTQVQRAIASELEVDLGIKRGNANAHWQLYDELPSHANPCPSSWDWQQGMSHRSTELDHRGQLWDPVRAIHSYKMYHFNLLRDEVLAATGALPPAAPPPPVRGRGTR